MIFPELMDPFVSMHIEYSEEGMVCHRENTPQDVLRVIERINSEYLEIHGEDLVRII